MRGMKRIFYIIAVLLALTWMFTFFILKSGGGVHVLMLMALICWVHAIIICPAPNRKYILKEMEEDKTGESERSIFKRQRA
jgi:tryptophan-rich sensory protein